jgi:hypothetical protein|tara:strand:+ start:13838 stop:14131 length:294 start_codon:yes stop_codon:yes gene_type:complete
MRQSKPKLIHVDNFGEVVVCDGCNGPYGDNLMGGVIIGRSAYCGECSDKYGYTKPDYEFADEVDEIMNNNETFNENVLQFRERITGSRDGIQKIYTW